MNIEHPNTAACVSDTAAWALEKICEDKANYSPKEWAFSTKKERGIPILRCTNLLLFRQFFKYKTAFQKINQVDLLTSLFASTISRDG